MGMRHAAWMLCLGLLAAPGVTLADAEPARIVVSGKRPGPGVWKVSKGEHVMWVFGLYSPLPKKMEWDSARVERLVAQSQEVLGEPGWSFGGTLFATLAALPAWAGIRRNPGDATLHEVLPAEVYTRWQALKTRYVGDDDGLERYRPVFAAEALLKAALKKNGLEESDELGKRIEKIARRNDVKLTSTRIRVTLENPRRDFAEFKQSQMDDLACFTTTLERFEGHLDAMRTRANVWAEGNMAEIRTLDFDRYEASCGRALLRGSFASNHPQLQGLGQRVRDGWFQAAETALANNTSTFAMLQMGDILGPDSYLALLQARGYTVESPK